MRSDDVPEEKDDSVKDTQRNDERAKAVAEAERIRELRERLYARGNAPTMVMRHPLPTQTREIHDTIEKPIEKSAKPQPESHEVQKKEARPVQTPVLPTTPPPSAPVSAVSYSEEIMATTSRRKSFRKKITFIGVIFFVIAMGIASSIMFSGNNTISGDNITISVEGPLTIGGGEKFPFKISITNQNTIPIESASLIIEYPRGTHSTTENGKELTIERKQLNTIETGEILNLELEALVFGEENEEKEIKVTIEYRISGSNATFDKKATPIRFKVSTSPVVMTFDSLKTISSGQEMELKLTIQSNSPTPLTNLLVKAVYPEGFDFSESEPETVSGEDTWKIETLKPAEKKVITIHGLMTGYEDETRRFTATAGVANATNEHTLVSMLATAQRDIIIEQPFLEVGVAVNGNRDDVVVVDSGKMAVVDLDYKNVLDSTIYDGKVLVELSGNALNEFEVIAENGFYDSTKNTITWDGVDEETLKEILPGKLSRVSFSLDPRDDIGRAPEIELKVTMRGQRVFEDGVPQELAGTASRRIKVESIPTIATSIYYETGPFTNTGPTPPIAEKITQYTYTLTAKAGTNDLTGAEVTAVIPQYVSWLDLVTDTDDVTYNATTRTMKWTIGDMDANGEESVSVQVSFLPSLTQVGTTPTLIESQRFKATDRFTGTVVRSDNPALTTSLFAEDDKDLHNGKVQVE